MFDLNLVQNDSIYQTGESTTLVLEPNRHPTTVWVPFLMWRLHVRVDVEESRGAQEWEERQQGEWSRGVRESLSLTVSMV
jgi:hypothetical protein